MDVLEAIRTKRSVRQFAEKPVPEEVIKKILDAGRRSQSSKNTQPWHFVVVQDRGTLAALAECGAYAGHLSGAAFGVAILSEVEWSFDIGQTAAYLQLAGWALGVSSCIASIYEPVKALKVLGAPPDMNFEIALSFGYAAVAPGSPRPGGRRNLAEVVHWERW